ncbi:MAG: hypothetical protein AB4041_20390 [Microcystaceae cyanobacterium]
MSKVTGLIGASFFPACLLILAQAILGKELSYSLLATGLFLLCIDQSRMAALDVRQVTEVRRDNSDHRLEQFWCLTLWTIIIELAGFYLASYALGWGIELVLLSQVGFNALAEIQLQPSEVEKVIPRPWSDRLPLIVANGMAMILMGLWMVRIAPLIIVSSLWFIAIAYAILKLWRLLRLSHSP